MPLPSNAQLIKKWKKRKSESEGSLGLQHDDATEAHAFHAGNDMYYQASIQEKGQKRSVVFNKVKPFVDAAVGFMIQLRRKPEYQAQMTNNDLQREYSDYLNSLSDYFRDNANMDSIETRQDREMLITGYGAVDTGVIYERNPDGEVMSEVISHRDIYWDPAAREPNLLDARYIYRRKPMHEKEALDRFKGTVPEDFESYYEYSDNYTYNPAGGEYDKISYNEGGKRPELVSIYYYQWWELERYYRGNNPLLEIQDPAIANMVAQMMVNMQEKRAEVSSEEDVDDLFEFDPFAETLVMTPTIKSDMQALFDRFGLEFDTVSYMKRVYYTALISGKKVLKKFKSPDQQGFTIKVKTGTYDPINNVWFGMVAGLKEPQRYSNKALTEILYVIASNSKGGVMYEESAVDNPARFEQQWATTKAAIQVNDGALSRGAIQPKAQAALPNGYENVYQVSMESMGEVSGLNREFLGISQNKAVSALLEGQRINQAITTLATYFDSIGLYQVEHARLMLTFIRQLADNSEGRLVKLLGADGAIRYVELSQDMFADEYDVSIGEAPVTAAQQQETSNLMIEMAQKGQEFGVNLWGTAIKYIPNIKERDKQEIMQAFDEQRAAQEEAAQAQQQAALQQQQRDDALQASVTNLQNSQAFRAQASGQKDLASISSIATENDKTRAETAKTLTETEQTVAENELLESFNVDNLNVTI